MSQGIHLVSNSTSGYTIPNRKCLASGRTPLLSYSSNRGHKLFGGSNLLKPLPIYTPRNFVITCKASNNHRRNPDFSRQKGNSRGKSRHYQERDHSESLDETDLLPSKNGSLLSLSSNNQRYSATATPGRREKEIVELFRKVQAQLRERAAIKEEKKIEASQQGQGERGTVDSLLKLLRKHSVAQGKKSSKEEDFNLDQSDKSTDSLEEEPNSNFFSSSSITTSEEVTEEDPVPYSRPRSKFRRRSPVPRVKFQPVFSAEEKVDVEIPEKKDSDDELEPELAEESVDEISDSSDFDEAKEDSLIAPTAEIADLASMKLADLASMKLTELRGLAKSRGVKGYSKLKKSDLIELLNGDGS